MTYKISNISITFVQPQQGLVAFASFVIDNVLQCTSVAIHQKLDGSGYRLTYPTKKVAKKDIYLFHPLQRNLSKAIESAVIGHFKNCNSTIHDRHGTA